MAVTEDFHLNKKIAKLRHCHTIYNNNLDLMYDENGNQTELRKEINKILYKIASGELGSSYLAGVNSEIKYAKKKKKQEEKLKKGIGKRHKPEPSEAKQLAALWRGVQKMQAISDGQKYKWLGKIGLRPHQLHKMYRRALPYYKDPI